ncbi:hypothetical protein [Streptococcus infantis]|uniref:hypothetical protein n=1 Tax=Streptococcus infantis TaxID=68892 RepID=UPI001F28B83C|nr:hypothetical protein [Streptococcus infantis]
MGGSNNTLESGLLWGLPYSKIWKNPSFNKESINPVDEIALDDKRIRTAKMGHFKKQKRDPIGLGYIYPRRSRKSWGLENEFEKRFKTRREAKEAEIK